MVPYPTQFGKNQYGEPSNIFIQGGSSQIDINFIIDHANGNGLGTRSLKGSPLVTNVFAYTSATPASGNPLGHTASEGLFIVQFGPAFEGYVGNGSCGLISPLSGSSINISSGLTVGKAYVITSVGTSTAANWQAVGLQANIVPSVGAAFVCTSATAGTGTGAVMLSTSSGLSSNIEGIGDPNQTCNYAGGYLIGQFLSAGTATQPVDGTVVGLRIVMLNQTAGPIN